MGTYFDCEEKDKESERYSKIGYTQIFEKQIPWFIEKKIVARGIIKQKALEELFHLPKGYGLTQLTITGESKEKGRSLAEAGFSGKDILVLSIERKDKLIPFPHANDLIQKGDKLLCYGLIKNIHLYAG